MWTFAKLYGDRELCTQISDFPESEERIRFDIEKELWVADDHSVLDDICEKYNVEIYCIAVPIEE